jgi:hypothetical protein
MTTKPIPQIDYGTTSTTQIPCDYPMPYGFIKEGLPIKAVKDIRTRAEAPEVYEKRYKITYTSVRQIQERKTYKHVK